MEFEVSRRNPSVGFVTIKVDGTNNILSEEQYIEIIKPSLRKEGSGKDYIEYRDKLLEAYFNPTTNPKDQFSW